MTENPVDGPLVLPANRAGTILPGSPFNSDPNSPNAVAHMVNEAFRRARSARRPLVAQWKRNYKVLHGKAWTAQAEPWMPSPRITQIFPVMFSSVSWYGDQRPTMSVIPSAQPFSPYADFYQRIAQDMNTVLEANFSNYNMLTELERMTWDMLTYNVGYTKCVWEPFLADGLGDAVSRRVDPFTIYPDPFARSVNDLAYIIEAKIMTVDSLDRAYPGAADRLQGRFGVEDVDEAPHRLDGNITATAPRVQMGSIDGAATRWGIGDARRREKEEPVVLVLEAWFRNHTAERETELTATVTDEWRCIVVCNDVVLLDAPADDVNAFGTHPYDKLVLTDIGEWYGPCMVEMLESPQACINRTLANIEHNIGLMGNPVLVESTRARSRGHRISNRPGQRIEADPTQVKWLDPPQMNPQIAVELMSFYKGEIESISGLSAMVRGFAPTGRNAQGVLDSVQDAAFVRVRTTLRQIEATMKSAGHKMAATIAEFYTEPRFISIVGQDGQQSVRALRARHFYSRDQQKDDDRIPLRFSLIADVGSSLSTSRQARAADAERMFALGIVDEFEVLKAVQWPNYAVVAKRVMEQKAAAGALGQPPGARQRTRA